MTDDLRRMMKKLEGDGPVEKHILLLKLQDALDRAPQFGDKPIMDAASPQRQWLAEVGALLGRLGTNKKVEFRAAFQTAVQYWKHATDKIKGQVLDAIEELKLELELDGRSEIGSAYAPGDVYRFFADLKAILNTAQKSLLVIDPYFDGSAFDACLTSAPTGIMVQVLADRYASDVANYVVKHRAQFSSGIELRSSKELHDRLVLVDDDTAWIMGGSIKDAGKKATYLIPLAAPVAEAKKSIYSDIWKRSAKVA
jgi:hypothetical protein